LDLLEKEMNTNHEDNGINLLKDLINSLSSRELSILQIVQENTGVITLNDNDCLSIERLSRSSLQNEEEYFLKSNTKFNFNFLYIQFYIIRSYLLLCRINYHHIHQKYQCYTQRQIILSTDKITTDKSLFTLNNPQFNYLQEMSLEKLYHGYNLLRKILNISKNYQDDLSNLNLYEFLQTIDNNEIYQQIKEYDIKDFQLSDIDDICQLYEQLINNFHYSIINTSHLLRIPIDNQQNDQLDQVLETTLIQSSQDKKPEELQLTIQTITNFLNELKDIEDTLLQQSSLSLIQVCEWLAIENPILSLISEEIKCENYILLVIKLIQIQSKLQEQTIRIEEKKEETWNDDFDPQPDKKSNTQESIEKLISKPDDRRKDSISSETTNNPIIHPTPPVTSDDDTTSESSSDDIHGTENPEPPSPIHNDRRYLNVRQASYTSLFELNVKSVPLTASILFEKLREQQATSSTVPNVLRFEIIHPDDTRQKSVCKIENIYPKLETVFEEKKYHFDKYIIVDQNQIFVDLLNENNDKSSIRISPIYQIIEKILLIPIILTYESKEIEYLATLECQLSSIINRFIVDHQLTFTSSDIYLGFYDELGSYIEEDKTISDIYRSNNTNAIRIRIIKYENNSNNLYEITLVLQEG